MKWTACSGQLLEAQEAAASRGVRTWAPAIEVSEREGNYVVCAELPSSGSRM
jgi:hypothetical protein